MKNVILLSFGKEYEWKRAIFSILSFWSWYDGNKNDVRTIIYTDNPDYFNNYLSDFNITYVNTSYAEIREVKRNAGGNMFRIKISVLERTFTQYPDDDLLYIDTDTFFRTNPEPLLDGIKPGQSFMHLRERTFEEAIDWAKWENDGITDFQKFPKSFVQLIEKQNFIIGGKEIKFKPTQYMWNAGALGMSKETASYIPDIYTLNDAFHANTLWRLSEQSAFSLVLNEVTTLSEAEEFINHYWAFKKHVDLRLKELLTENFIKLSQPDKIEIVKQFTQRLDKYLYHEQMISQTRNSLREKDFKSALSFVTKAVTSVPLNDDLVKSIKYRLFKLAS